MADKIFSLEALNAFHGDCFLLHYGTSDKPKIMLIDGGPNGTFKASLRPRIQELSEQRGAPLKLDQVMVSHLDDDHIAGVLQVVDEIEQDTGLCKANSFWFNTFDDAIKAAPPQLAEASAELGLSKSDAVAAAAECASIQQGRTLRDAVTRIHAKQNGGHDLLFADGKGVALDINDLDVTMVCPDKQHLADLAGKWASSPNKKAEAAAYVDKSVFNLSSLVVVVSPAGDVSPRILLTGDARGDHIIAGLTNARLLTNGKAHFDIFKVPHHGSDNNLTLDFFQAITADHYVISGDGKYANPSKAVLEWIAATAPANAKVWLTYDQNPQYKEYGPSVAEVVQRYPHLSKQLRVRKPNELLMRIELLTPLLDV